MGNQTRKSAARHTGADDEVEENGYTRAQNEEHARRQKEAATRTAKAQAEAADDEINPHVSSQLTTEEHVGKIAAEPHKPRTMEARKTDESERTGVDKVTTVARKTAGKGTTDQVVSDPATAVTTDATTTAKTEADKNRDALEAGKRRQGRGRSR